MKTLQQLHNDIVETNTATLLAQVAAPRVTPHDKPISIYFLMNFTLNPIEPILKHYLYESKMCPDIIFGQYDNVMQEVLDEQSLLRSKKFDMVVCALWQDVSDVAILSKLDDTEFFINELTHLFDLIQEKTRSLVLINTFIPPFWSENGITPIQKQNKLEAILEVNQFIRQYVKRYGNRIFLMDWAGYVQRLGEQESLDYRYWYLYKAPFKKSFLSHYAADMTRVARALNGFAKKCLILDADNTLWGGVIGEDGLADIKLDQHHYPGNIFYDFQKSVLALHQRGVILALCSKNNEADVWEVMEKHPCSLLKKEHFATCRINWLDKADNIVDLVQELNIGLDSCVFVDDSQTECERVRLALPDVTVIPVPNPLYAYPTLLFKEGLFDTLSVSQDDALRNLKYQQEAKRKVMLKKSQNITDYLASLELVAIIRPLNENDWARVSQLTQKTNQFNLSTHRYTQQEIENFYYNENYAIFSLQVKDKFGDYGLTGVFIAKREAECGVIDSFLLSCRILSRHLEFVFLEHCLKTLSKEWQLKQWEAPYFPTEKNIQLPDFLHKAGFKTDNNTLYRLRTDHWDGYHINHISVMTEGMEYA